MMAEWAAGSTVLVVGAREHGLGWEIAGIVEEFGGTVQTAGVSGEEDFNLDVLDETSIGSVMSNVKPCHVIVTTGINIPGTFDRDDFGDNFAEHMAINTFGPINVLKGWLPYMANGGHFVVISSNSAHIARSNSLSYCMSKAALSMGIRCIARDISKSDQVETPTRPIVYGWELGLLKGTPMTQAIAEALPPETPLTRMPGQEHGLTPWAVAQHIVSTVKYGWRELNGVMLRLDAGDQ